MWKTLYEIRLIRFEGVPMWTQCSISLNNNQLEKLGPESSERNFIVGPNGKYQIHLTDQDSNTFSVSFNFYLFEDDGMVWLPLFSNQNDFVSQQPEEVKEPRLLLLVHKKLIDNAMLQDENIVPDHEYMPEIKLNYCENTMIIYEDKEEISYCNESSIKYDNSQIDENSLIEKNQEDKDISHDKVLEIATQFQQSLKNQKDLTDKIIKEAETKDKEILAAVTEILELKNKLQKIESENEYLRSMSNNNLEYFIKELQISKEKSKPNTEKNLQDLKENKETQDYEGKTIENYLRMQCEELNIENLAKDEEEVYLYGTKKLYLSIRSGKLVCRLGNIYKDFKKTIEEINSESKVTVTNNVPNRGPFRKNLGEINCSLETPKQLSKSVDPSLKPQALKKNSKTLKSNKIVKRIV